MMKLLWLGSSNDVEGFLPVEQRSPALSAKLLSDAIGSPVEVAARAIWPTPGLPSLVERWMDEEKPDMVFLRAVTYWVAYESVPLKIQRTLPLIGKPIANAGLKAAETKWLSTTRGFHWGRTLAHRVIGGATAFEPSEVVECMTLCARTILRKEDTVLLLQGPRHAQRYHASERSERRGEQRRLQVHRALNGLAADLHCTYAGLERPVHENVTLTTGGDRLHYDPEAHEVESDFFGAWLINAWNDAHNAEIASSAEEPAASGPGDEASSATPAY